MDHIYFKQEIEDVQIVDVDSPSYVNDDFTKNTTEDSNYKRVSLY